MQIFFLVWFRLQAFDYDIRLAMFLRLQLLDLFAYLITARR